MSIVRGRAGGRKATPSSPRPLLVGLLVGLLGAAAVHAPPTAWASFTASATASVSVGTLSLPRPSAAQGSAGCPTRSIRAGRVTVTSFAQVQRATRYVLTLTSPRGSTDSATVTGSQTVSLSVPSSPSAGRGRWTVRIVPGVSAWTGPAWTATFTC